MVDIPFPVSHCTHARNHRRSSSRNRNHSGICCVVSRLRLVESSDRYGSVPIPSFVERIVVRRVEVRCHLLKAVVSQYILEDDNHNLRLRKVWHTCSSKIPELLSEPSTVFRDVAKSSWAVLSFLVMPFWSFDCCTMSSANSDRAERPGPSNLPWSRLRAEIFWVYWAAFLFCCESMVSASSTYFRAWRISALVFSDMTEEIENSKRWGRWRLERGMNFCCALGRLLWREKGVRINRF